MKPWIVFSGLKIMAGLLVAWMALGTQARADIVYTTAATANTSSAQTANNGQNTTNLQLGTWTGNVFNFNTNQSAFRFTTNGSLGTNGTWSLTGLNSTLYVDPPQSGGSQGSATITGTLNWTLYSGTPTSQVATYTQTISQISVTAKQATSNVYQNNLFSLGTGTNVLNANTQYTLLLTGGSINLNSGATMLDGSDLHWAYYSGTPAATGQLWSGITAGSTTGAYSATNTAITSANIAFDINAAAIPEPNTLTLGSIAAVACACLWWYRRKTGPQAAAQGT